MAEFATLADVKAHTNITSTGNDDELDLMLDAAEDIVRSLIGPVSSTQVSERITAHGGTAILSGRPSGEVLLNGGAVTGHTVNAAAGLLYDVPAVYGPLTASYQVGGGAVPAAVTLATAIIVEHLWQTQRGTSPSPLALQQPVDEQPFGSGSGFSIPNRAKELLEPFAWSAAQIA